MFEIKVTRTDGETYSFWAESYTQTQNSLRDFYNRNLPTLKTVVAERKTTIQGKKATTILIYDGNFSERVK